MLSKHANLHQYKKGNKDQITSTVEHSLIVFVHTNTHTQNIKKNIYIIYKTQV